MREPDNKTVIVEARTVLESGADAPEGLEGPLETSTPRCLRKRTGTVMMASGIVAVAVSLAMYIPAIIKPADSLNAGVSNTAPVISGGVDQNEEKDSGASLEKLPRENLDENQDTSVNDQAEEEKRKENSGLFNFTDGLTLAGLTASQKGTFALQSRGRFCVTDADSDTPVLVVDPVQGDVSISGPLAATGDISAPGANLGEIKSSVIVSENATVDTADVADLTVEDEQVGNAHIASADIESAMVESLKSTNSDTESLKATAAQIGDATVDNLKASGVNASAADISGEISAGKITTEDFSASDAQIDGISGERLSYSNLQGNQLDVQNAKFKTISTGACLVDTLDSALIDSGAIAAESVECDSAIVDTLLEAVNARLNFVSAIDVSASTLRATTVEADSLSAQDIATNSLNANRLSVGSFETNSFEADTLAGELVTFKVSNNVRGSVSFEGIGVETQEISVPGDTKAVYLSVNYNPENPYVFAYVSHRENRWKIVCVTQELTRDTQIDDGSVDETQNSVNNQEDMAFQGIEVCWLAVG